jgi:NAD-dependent deacetylase
LIGDASIVELHGSYRRHRCTLCGPIHAVLLSETMALPVRCPRCQLPEAIVRPDVVMFGERIDPKGYDRAQVFVRQADILIIAGTTLQFSYLANLIAEAVEVNALVIYVDPQASPYKQSLLVLDQALDIEHKLLCIRQSADQVLPELSSLIIEGASQQDIQAWCGEHAGRCNPAQQT